MANKELQYSDEIERLQAEHSRALADKEKPVEEHSATVTQEVARLTAAFEESKTDRATLEAALRAEIDQVKRTVDQKSAEEQQMALQARHKEALKALRDEHATALANLQRQHTHVEELELLTESHRSTLSSLTSDSENQHTPLVKEHTEEVARPKVEHETAIASA